jgi:hypothetical protein
MAASEFEGEMMIAGLASSMTRQKVEDSGRLRFDDTKVGYRGATEG